MNTKNGGDMHKA